MRGQEHVPRRRVLPGLHARMPARREHRQRSLLFLPEARAQRQRGTRQARDRRMQGTERSHRRLPDAGGPGGRLHGAGQCGVGRPDLDEVRGGLLGASRFLQVELVRARHHDPRPVGARPAQRVEGFHRPGPVRRAPADGRGAGHAPSGRHELRSQPEGRLRAGARLHREREEGLRRPQRPLLLHRRQHEMGRHRHRLRRRRGARGVRDRG